MQRRSGSGEARTLFWMHRAILSTNNETYLFYFYGNTYYTYMECNESSRSKTKISVYIIYNEILMSEREKTSCMNDA